jgi:high-affinity iron transporter
MTSRPTRAGLLRLLLLAVLVTPLALPWRGAAAADDDATLAAGLATLVAHADAASTALGHGDAAAARAAYTQFDDLWFAIEDGVRERSRPDYRSIERAMDDVKFGLRADPPDSAAVQADLATLRGQVLQFSASLDASPAVTSAAAAPAGDADGQARDGLRPWAARIDDALARLKDGDVAGARAGIEAFRTAWPEIEDPIRAASRSHYREIERATGDAQVALATQPPDRAAAQAALERLQAVNAAFLAGTAVPGDAAAATAPAVSNPTPATLIELLDQALAALDRGDSTAARADVRTFQGVWLDVEGFVLARSPAVYTSSENRMAEAAAALSSSPPRVDEARTTLTAMRADLLPIAEAGNHYGIWDAAIILFREGFEALLVVAALLAFLQRSGNEDKRGWIWGGAGVGIGASLVVAVVAQVVLSRAVANVGRELIEGVTGLVAAAMLLYMGYWLHSKASLASWQEYIRTQSTAALKRNSLIGLAVIAFLAVFREGAETVLFYVGIAPSIALHDLVLGLGLGLAGLAVLAVLMLGLGVRVPVRPFFLAATVLIYYLCFKFVGTSIHALQVSGWLPSTPAPYLPSWDFLGLFPTWETTCAQLLVLLLIVLISVAPSLRAGFQRGASPAHSA